MRGWVFMRLRRGVVYYADGLGLEIVAPLVGGRARYERDGWVLLDIDYEQARLMHYMHHGPDLATDAAREWRRGCMWLVDASPTYEQFRASVCSALAMTTYPMLLMSCSVKTRNTELVTWQHVRVP